MGEMAWVCWEATPLPDNSLLIKPKLYKLGDSSLLKICETIHLSKQIYWKKMIKMLRMQLFVSFILKYILTVNFLENDHSLLFLT